ncbi:MAG: hypothetical protein Kow00117_03280 [Phototrophicales bacterium]
MTTSPETQIEHPSKLVILAVMHDDERQAFSDMLTSMQLRVMDAASAFEALQLLEDYNADLLIMDTQLPDMHGWQMLNKIKEIVSLHHLSIIVLGEQPNLLLSHITPSIEYLHRPISIAKLKQNVWNALK